MITRDVCHVAHTLLRRDTAAHQGCAVGDMHVVAFDLNIMMIVYCMWCTACVLQEAESLVLELEVGDDVDLNKVSPV
jgi:hypothetical protein